jgi:DMSO/TMAO reductase YedYZ molybdopterin-dependent catalytic subunit
MTLVSKRTGINYPKFKDQFAVMDFDAEPMPVLSLFPMPAPRPISQWSVLFTGVSGERKELDWRQLQALPRVRERAPLVCQIFNWAEEAEVEGVRLADALRASGVGAPPDGYLAFYSADGLYFESLPRSLAWDSRTLLVFGLNGEPLPHQYGGPLRLWVPFLQGYKSVKWVYLVRAFRKDPLGIKRLLGQSRTALLGGDNQEKAGVVMAAPNNGESLSEI